MKQSRKNDQKFVMRGIVIIICLIMCMFLSEIMIYQGKQEKSVIPISMENFSGDNNTNGQLIETGKVIVKYLDEAGNELRTQEVLEGQIGTEYTTSRKEIDHYMSNGKEPFNKVGNFGKKDITVTYTYKLVSDALDVTSNDNLITLKVENELINKEYKLRLEQESVEGTKLTGGKFTLIDDQEDKTLMSGTTINGALTLGVINVAEEGNETFALNEDKAPRGYKKVLQNKAFGINLLKSYNQAEGTYEVRASSPDVEFELEEDTQNNEIIVRVINDMAKIYDLSVKQFASSIDGEDTGRDISAYVTTTGDIEYSEKEKNLPVKDKEKIVYTIRVFNEGNQNMNGQKVIYTLPKGLKFVEDSQINKENEWKITDGVLYTEKITDQIIEGIDTSKEKTVEFKELQVELEVVKDEATEGNTLTTIATIPLSPNEENEDNNTSSETVVLTGESLSYDLAMKKFLYSVDGKNLKDREVIAKNNNSKITFTENDEIYKVSNNQKLVYTLRVYNMGEGLAEGRSVIENIPDGLQLVKDSSINKNNGWKMYKEGTNGKLEEVNNVVDATVVKTDILEKQKINGFKVQNNEVPNYIDVQIELVVVEDNITSEDRIAINTAKVDNSRLDPDPTNDEDEEKVYVKQFDLNVRKYIQTITIEDDEGSETTELGLAQKGNMYKREVDKKKVNQTTVYVTYILEVTNIGEIEGYATELTDFVPDNFELDESSKGWTVNGNIATTDILKDKLIEPGKSKLVPVSFIWRLNEDNLGARTNTAITSAYKNDYDAIDKTPDKDNSDTFIISLKTGEDAVQTLVYTVMILAACITILTIIIVKRNNKK